MKAQAPLLKRYPTDHHEIDAAATDVARQVFLSTVSERDARWALAALIYGSDVPEKVVFKAAAFNTGGGRVPQQVAEDSRDYVREQLTKTIVGPKPKLDLRRIADGQSLCGWASRIISGPAVFPKKNFDSRTRRTREVTVSNETISGLVAIRSFADSMPYLGIDPTNTIDDFRHDIVDEFLLLAKGLREWELVHLSAEHICAVSDVRAPRRSIDLPNRKSLLARLDTRTNTTRQDLTDYLTNGVLVPDSLANVFTNLEVDDLDDVIRLDALSSQMLARSALTPVPPPREPVMRALRTSINKVVGQPKVAAEIVKAYAGVIAETAGSEFTPDASARRIKTATARRHDFERWESDVRTLVDTGCVGLGLTPDEVFLNLNTRARRISVDRAIKSIAA
jgi:hypothetical protein